MATKRVKQIGIDTSLDMYHLRVVCMGCVTAHDRRVGTPIYRGDEWGGGPCECDRCGAALDVTEVQDPR